jgi:hypothetical protein
MAWAGKFQRTKGKQSVKVETLDKLIAAVDAGAIARHDLDAFIPWRGLDSLTNDSLDAYNGSLDAAKRLHDALLFGWSYLISENDAEIWPTGAYPQTTAAQAMSNPARAWLLAILRAMRSDANAAAPPPDHATSTAPRS